VSFSGFETDNLRQHQHWGVGNHPYQEKTLGSSYSCGGQNFIQQDITGITIARQLDLM
jgi:hypothetical protein